MADVKGARDRIAEIAHSWSVSMHGVQRVYDKPPASYGGLEPPAVVIANVNLPIVSFTSGQIQSTYGITVDFLLSPNETESFDGALEALPMMVEDLATDLELNTICTGALTIAGADPSVGIFDFQAQSYIAARVVVNCGFIDAASVSVMAGRLTDNAVTIGLNVRFT